MIQYLLSKPSFTLYSSDVVVELGSGCGLLAIWLAQHYRCQVLATDMIQQLPLLQQNIVANHAESNCIMKELHWSNQEHCENIFNLVERKRLVAIFAADVLYDQSAIPALANTLSILCSTHKHIPAVYVAQKNRNKRSIEDIRKDLLIYFPNTKIDCEYDEANVIIWVIQYQR
jgi:predicted nicotinamide N-methyase